MQEQGSKTISGLLTPLEVGDTAKFPISKALVVRVMACNLGVVSGRKYATRTDREAGIIEVTRKS